MDHDTLFPLQAALGYEITKGLYVGEHTLLVEEPADLLYLKAMSNELAKRDRVSLDSRWVVCPEREDGIIDNIAAFVSQYGGNNPHVAV